MNVEKLFFWRNPAESPQRLAIIRDEHVKMLETSMTFGRKADMLKQDLARLALKAVVKPVDDLPPL